MTVEPGTQTFPRASVPFLWLSSFSMSASLFGDLPSSTLFRFAFNLLLAGSSTSLSANPLLSDEALPRRVPLPTLVGAGDPDTRPPRFHVSNWPALVEGCPTVPLQLASLSWTPDQPSFPDRTSRARLAAWMPGLVARPQPSWAMVGTPLSEQAL